MRYLELREPNFRARVQDPGGNFYENLYFAESEEGLREILKEDGAVQTILSIEPYDFGLWKAKAQQALEVVLEAKRTNKKPKFNQRIWGELKQFLFFLSRGKCGYCETHNVQVISSGHVEHYRPKRKVQEDKEHPGYYWLAYDITNYVPCCEQCNAVRGKKTQFPIENCKKYIKKPSEIRKEPRLLLHPFMDRPEQHLVFIDTPGAMQGWLKGLNPMGETSITVYNLNRGDLVYSRCRHLDLLRPRLDQAKINPALREKIIREYKLGTLEYVRIVQNVFRILLRLYWDSLF